MLRSFKKIWLLLFLFPYLFFAVIGGVPHQHGHNNHAQPFSLRTTGFQSGNTSWVAVHNNDINDNDQCALCIAQSTLSACASFSLPHYSLPVIQTDETLGYRVILSRYNPSLFSSRAPPSHLS